MVFYALAKLAAYTIWSYIGVRLVQPGRASFTLAAQFGVIRWFLGLAFGIALFFLVGSIDASDAARTYALVYTPIRAIEWSIMVALIDRRVERDYFTMPLWCVGGIVLSFLADLLSPEGLQGRFCIGRCLC
jgi:hypothetical protein